MNHSVQDQSDIFSQITEELKSCIKHSEASQEHFSEGEVPRGCAHAFALDGHLAKISFLLEQAKKKHAEMAKF